MVDSVKISNKMIFGFFSILILFFGFYQNQWNASKQEHFDNYEWYSESLIIGRLIESQQNGIFSHAGLTGWTLTSSDNKEITNKDRKAQYGIYENNLPTYGFEPYKSQIGFQGIFFGLIDKVTNFSNKTNIKIFRIITSIASAIALTFILLWFNNQFGIFASTTVLLFLIFSNWITLFGRNLWWSLWVFYMPMISSLILLEREELKGYSNKVASVTIFFAVLIKCLFNGYEFITTTLIMMVVPLIYYGKLKSWKLNVFCKRMIVFSLSSILGVLSSFMILFAQISLITGSYYKGYEHIIYSFLRRTHGDPSKFGEGYQAGLNASTTYVIMKYLKGVAIKLKYIFDVNYLPKSNIQFYELIILFLISTLLIFIFRNKSKNISINYKKISALSYAAWFSILAPFSWFVIFKEHSYDHFHIDYIVWYMPFTLFGIALFGGVFWYLSKDVLSKVKKL